MINVEGITKDYGNSKGVFNLTFQVEDGETMGFLGPNGAGKTTTIRQLLGFIKPDNGSVRINEMDCFKNASVIQKDLGYLPGEIAFIDSMTGTEFIKFIADMKGVSNLNRAKQLIDMFELDPKGKIMKMSKGMKQKIGIVCAFMQNPQILILDEPTSGLDPLMQNRFVELILEEKKKGRSILMSSHIFEEVEKTCDRAAIIREGKLVATDTISGLCADRKKNIDITFLKDEMAQAFAKNINGCVIIKNKVSMLWGNEIDRVIKEASKYDVIDMNVENQSLEEYFMHFYIEKGAKQ